MAVELKNSIFIHCPKTGGKFVTKFLLENIQGSKMIGDRVWDAHSRYSLNSKTTFGFIRHPVSFIESLWSHRKRKKNHDTHEFNWQDHIRLERDCKNENLETFILNVSKQKNLIWDFYMFYLGGHRNFIFCKFENMEEDLKYFLSEYESFYNFENLKKLEKNETNRKKNFIPKDLQKKILISEEILSKKFNYDFFLD